MYTSAQRNIKIAVGSIYDCTVQSLGTSQFDGIWDCSAIVAVNPEDRTKYVDILISLLKPKGKILLSTYDYDQSIRTKFPHSFPERLVRSLFEPHGMKVTVSEVRSNDKLLHRFMTGFNVSQATRPVFYIQKE